MMRTISVRLGPELRALARRRRERQDGHFALLFGADEQHLRRPAGQADLGSARRWRHQRHHRRPLRRRSMSIARKHPPRQTTFGAPSPDSRGDSSAPLVVPINGDTGIYRRAHGAITARNVGNNTDFAIRVTC